MNVSLRWFGALLMLSACGGNASSTDAGSDASNDTGPTPDASFTDMRPPPPPDGGSPTTNVYTFAIKQLLLGESDRSTGTPSMSAWKNFGYDLDGLATNMSSTNVCTLAAGAPKLNQVDGTGGIDNAWGSAVIPLIQSAASLPTPSETETHAIDVGAWTFQIQVTGLSDSPTQSAVGLSMQAFLSGPYNGTPAFDTSTDWPVLPTSVNDGQTIASGSTMRFASAYVTNGTFVSGPSSSPVVISILDIPVAIHDAVITFDHVDHADAANGTIAGVLHTSEFLSAFQAVAGRISTSLCGSAFDGIAQQIKQAQDILADGTNNASQACDAISIGIGFSAVLVANPTQVVAPPTPPSFCPGGDAGVDAPSDGPSE